MANRTYDSFESCASPSAWNRVINCGGSVSLFKDNGFAQGVQSEIATRGTKIHLLAQHLLKGKEIVGKIDEVAEAKRYYEFVVGAKKQFLKNREFVHELIEASLDIGLGFKGEIDYGLIAKDSRGIHVLQVDLKTGFTDVEVKNNEQAIGYLKALRELVFSMYEQHPTMYHSFIFQGGGWKKHSYTGDEFNITCDEILFKLEKAKKMYDKKMAVDLNAGKWCTYCPVLSSCPEHYAVIKMLEKLV